MRPYEIEFAHLIRMASSLPAWKAYAWAKAQRMQASGEHPGIADALKAHMQGQSKPGEAPKAS